MPCEAFRTRLPGFALWELSPEDVLTMKQHLLDCADCRRSVALYLRIDTELQEIVRPRLLHVPPGFSGRLDRRLSGEAKQGESRLRITGPRLPAARPGLRRSGTPLRWLIGLCGAAGLAALLLLVYWAFHPGAGAGEAAPGGTATSAPSPEKVDADTVKGGSVPPPPDSAETGTHDRKKSAAVPAPPEPGTAARSEKRGKEKTAAPQEREEDVDTVLVRRVEGPAIRLQENVADGLQLRDGDRLRPTDRVQSKDSPVILVIDRRVRPSTARPGNLRVMRPTRLWTGDLEIVLAPQSELRVSGRRSPSVILASGQVAVRVGDAARSVAVETVAGRVVSRPGPWGQGFLVSMSGAESRVGILEGRVVLEMGTQTTELLAGQEATVAVGGGVSPIRPLDPAWTAWLAESVGGAVPVYRAPFETLGAGGSGPASGDGWKPPKENAAGEAAIEIRGWREVGARISGRDQRLLDGWLPDELAARSALGLRRAKGLAASVVSDPISVEAGAVYRVRFAACADGGEGAASVSVLSAEPEGAYAWSTLVPVGELWNAFALEYRVPPGGAGARMKLRFDWAGESPVWISDVRVERLFPGERPYLASHFDEGTLPPFEKTEGLWRAEGAGGLQAEPVGAGAATVLFRNGAQWSRYRVSATVYPPVDGEAGLILAAAADGSSAVRFVHQSGAESAWEAVRIERGRETSIGRRVVPRFAKPETAGGQAPAAPGDPFVTVSADWIEDQLLLYGNGELLFQAPLGDQRAGSVGLIARGGRTRFDHLYVVPLQR